MSILNIYQQLSILFKYSLLFLKNDILQQKRSSRRLKKSLSYFFCGQFCLSLNPTGRFNYFSLLWCYIKSELHAAKEIESVHHSLQITPNDDEWWCSSWNCKCICNMPACTMMMTTKWTHITHWILGESSNDMQFSLYKSHLGWIIYKCM